MARKTDGEKIDDLMEKVTRIAATFEERSARSEKENEQLRAELAASREETRRVLDRLAAVEARGAATEERSKAQEKQSDRGWQMWLAALGFGFGLLNLLITAALQLRK